MDWKKYWWVIAIVIVVIVFLLITQYSSKEENCKKISWDEWIRRKTAYKEQFGSWDLAHAKMLDAGYCEQLG